MSDIFGIPVRYGSSLPADVVIYTKDKPTLINVVELETKLAKLQAENKAFRRFYAAHVAVEVGAIDFDLRQVQVDELIAANAVVNELLGEDSPWRK